MATILFVDDEPSVDMIIEDTLQRAGHQTVGCRNVGEALQVLARGDIDLIISDYRMPGLTGLEFLQLLAREGYDIPLIMLTGYGSIPTAIAATRLGADHFLTKPSDAEQILAAYERINQGAKPDSEPATSVPSLARVEWEHIQRVLADCGGNVSQAAKLLGLHRRSLQRKLYKDPPMR